MVWCVVSGCENRSGKGRGNPGILNRPQKKFFSFPSDPKRVKVWLAALREMDKLDSPDQHFICEDHFLPQDVSAAGVNSDAIPIMPPCLDGPMDMISSWAAESSEEEEEEDEWQTEGYDNVYEGGISFPLPRLPAVDPPPAINPPTQDPDTKKTSETKNPSSVKSPSQKERVRPGKPLATQILELLRAAPDGILDLNRTMLTLETSSFRVWEITCVLQGINLVEKMPRNRIRWIGGDLSSSSLNQQHFQAEVENLKATEENLDRLIRSCSEQLFDLTDDKDNAALAYVTPEDLCRIEAFRQQEVMVVKAPDGTSLKIPAPTEDSIQLHFKGRKGPIQVLTCDIRTGDSAAEESGRFLTVEESQIKSSALHKDSEDSSLLVLQSVNPRQPVELPLSNEEESNQHEGSWRRETPEQDAEDQTIQGEDRPFLEGTFITVFKEEPFDPELKEREPTSSQEEKAPYEEEPSDPEPQTEKTELCGGTCEAKTEVSAAPYTPQEEEFQAPYKEEPSDPEPQKEEKELCGGTSEVKTDVSTAPYKPQDEKFQALYKEEPSDPEPQKEEKVSHV
uniref:THAP-type domain-containing protein n=1 Tax=Labrus bergylta TaxID=56723 RepID=A0A3Q3LB02_9LABR